MKPFKYLMLAGALLVFATAARAQNTFTYSDDEAEAGGYDVTLSVRGGPVELSLAEQPNGDGYRLKLAPELLELSARVNGKTEILASERGSFQIAAPVVQRRGVVWRVIAGNRVALEAEDDRFHSGKIGWRGNVEKGRVQPVEAVTFDDDFMRVASDVAMAQAKTNPRLGVKITDVKTAETLWTTVSGAWSTTGLNENEQAQVAQSANPFAFKAGAAGQNLALAGKAFWSDYAAEVSVKPQGASAVGLALLAQDAKNYLLFFWPQNGVPQIRAIVDGQTRVLDENKSVPGFDQKQWYRLRFSVAGGLLRAFVDDTEILRARTGLFGRGQVGLYAENPAASDAAVFDDVRVRGIADFYDDFERAVPGRWKSVAGTWKMTNFAAPASADGAFAVMGEISWQDYDVSARLQIPADGAAGLLLHHQSGKGAYLLRVAGSKSKLSGAGKVQICKIAGGQTLVLSEKLVGDRFDNSSQRWTFSDERGYLKAEVEGARLCDAFDETSRGGRAGIYAQRGAGNAPKIANFAVEFPRARPTWAKVPELYELEQQAQTMGGWSTPEGFWVASTATGGAAGAAQTFRHKGTFWGDGSIRFKLPALTGNQSVNLTFEDAKNHSAALTLSLQIADGNLQAKLSRGEKSWDGSAKIAGEAAGQLIEVERRGDFLIARLGAPETAKTLLAARVD